MIRYCVDPTCTVALSIHNPNIRCFHHATAHVELQTYVQEKELKRVTLDRWSAGQTSKHHLRDPYVRKFKDTDIIPWESNLEEAQTCAPVRFAELLSLFREAGRFHDYASGADLDTWAPTLSYNEAVLIDSIFPETDFLTRWSALTTEGSYKRFRSPLDELERAMAHHNALRDQRVLAFSEEI